MLPGRSQAAMPATRDWLYTKKTALSVEKQAADIAGKRIKGGQSPDISEVVQSAGGERSGTDEGARSGVANTESLLDKDGGARSGVRSGARKGTRKETRGTKSIAEKTAASAGHKHGVLDASNSGAALARNVNNGTADDTQENTNGGSAKDQSGNTRRAQKVSKSRTEPAIEVRDFRTADAVESADGTSILKESTEAPSGENETNIRYVRFSDSRPAASSNTSNSPFSVYVRENLSAEMVKQTGIILKNNDRGEIRLVLKPENLGRVRMRIQLDENRLSGRIFVESGFVKDSLEQNLEELYRAFRSNGYETAEFEVLVDGEQDGRAPGEKQRQNLDAKNP